MIGRHEISSKQRLTDRGVLGVVLFLAGPFVMGVGYWWLASELSKEFDFSRDIAGPSLLLLVGGYASLIGCVLMLVGRQHDIAVRQTEARKETGKQLWS